MKLSVDRTLNKARLALKKGDISEARQLCNQVLAAYPGNSRAQAALDSLNNPGQSGSRSPAEGAQAQLKALVSLFNQNRLSEVIELGEKLTRTSPRAFIVYNILGAANSRLDRTEKAIDCFETAVRIKPDYADGHANLGNVLVVRGRHKQAVTCYQTALKYKPDNADLHNILGITLKKLGRFEEAVVCFETAAKLTPNDATALFNLGLAQQRLHRNAEAIDSFSRAIELNPGHADAHNNLAEALQLAGRTDETIASFTKTLQYQPANTELRLKLATILNKSNRLEEAADCIARVLESSPDDADLHNNLGNLTLRLYGFDKAITCFRKALSLKSKHELALLNLCVCCVHSGRFAEANDLLIRLHELRPQATSVVKLFLKLPKDIVNLDLMTALDNCRRQYNQTERGFEVEWTFLRAELMDRECRYEEAWQHVTKANALAYPEHAEPHKRQAESWACDIEQVHRYNIAGSSPVIEGSGADYTVPLYILGPSRAGKTTLETLVSSESRIGRGYENAAVEASATRVSLTAGAGDVRSISDLPKSLLTSFAEDFRRRLKVTYGDKKVVTITNPGHISHVQSLAEALPEARFVFVTRNQDDNALRIFMNTYNEGNHHAYDINTVHQYLEWYETVTELLVSRLADRCVHLRYEEMVSEPIANATGVWKLCGLASRGAELPAIGSDVGAAAPYMDFVRELRR